MKEISADTTEIQGILRDNHEQLYARTLDKLKEMNKFLETYNIPIQYSGRNRKAEQSGH